MERTRQAGNSGSRARRAVVVPLLVAAVAGGAILVGCNTPPAVNPWRDDSIPMSAYSTASSETVAAANQPPAIRVRQYPPTQAPMVDAGVPHYPLWWEDPFEDQGDNDHQFAWTWQDYFAMPYGEARFLLNTGAWPISAVVTLPGTPMVSDGVVGKVHDARRGVSPDPTAGPLDFVSHSAEMPANEATPDGLEPSEVEPLPAGPQAPSSRPAV